MMRSRLSFVYRSFFLLLVLLFLFTACRQNLPDDRETQDNPPVFSGLHDIEILQGDGIAYRTGVRATDPEDGVLQFAVDASAVDLDTPGEYVVIYTAVDSAGNRTEERIRVTVVERLVSFDTLWQTVDQKIAAEGLDRLSRADLCERLYYYIKANMSYTSDSDKSDWVAEAYRGMTDGEGDCFTYYAMARAFFERLGVSVLTVQRAPNVLPSTHYWLLVNMGNEEDPAWYHWDVCPHYKEFPLTSILLTDAELLEYNQQVANYYTFDASLYPATPTEPYR
ncbi:MAG: DUF5011 domain-containing protein [Ruminococcaceae bacterium]|nr:DUF5011 domain-containing protein [Oscillospiraceae bacterium]